MGFFEDLNLFGQKQKAEADSLYNKRESELRGYFTDAMRPYLQTAEAQSVLGQLRKQFADQSAALNNNAVSTGATDEAKTAAKQAQNETYSGMLSKLSGYGTQRRDNLGLQYNSMLNQLYGEKQNRLMQEQQAIWNAWSNLLDTGAKAGSLFAMGGGA